MNVEEVPEPGAARRSRPEDLLAWVAGYAVELGRVGSGPLRRVSVSCGGTTVEVEWSPRAAAAFPAVEFAANGDGNHAAEAPRPERNGGEPPGRDAADGSRIVVASPMVGTFYRAPEPGAAPYVEVGDVVEAGQQVGIVEAMKLMNPILAECAGRVAEIVADDGAPVEYEQPLIVLVPDDGR
jgi:acetyl-CoA carboxylase biotin carboxyl carrier protein